MKKRSILLLLAVIVIVISSAIFAAEYYTSRSGFCGSCHIMKKYYDSWALGKHKDVECVDCHYAPGEHYSVRTKFRGLGQLFTYISTGDKTVRKPAVINDQSCLASDCHPQQKLDEKKYIFKQKIFYIHKTHFDKSIEGQTLHCETCHQHVSADRHFEVPRVACYLCHFKNTEFNEGRAQCSLCHEIPAGSLQKQKQEELFGEKPVTHQSLKEAKVPCQSCHYELVRGEGEIKEEACLDCHDVTETLSKFNDRNLMHQEHVARQAANCFDCHRPIRHEQVEFLDPVRESCFICHPDHHKYQKMLLMGENREDVMMASGLMYDVKTNCIGCHLDERMVKGEKVLHGSAKACVSCHTEKHYDMVKEWKDKSEQELQYARQFEQQAKEAIDMARGKISQEKLDKALAMFREGQENLRIVEYGGGVHNKKYSVVLLDAAMDSFEDTIGVLKQYK